MAFEGRELRSTITEDGKLTLSLETVQVGPPGPGEVVVKVEATPINPSDLGLLLGPADMASLRSSATSSHPALVFDVPPERLSGVHGRLGQALSVGNEGAGTVIAAGEGAAALVGKRVGMSGGGMFADYRKLPARDVVPLPEGTSAAAGAAMFVNPLTALAFVETARSGGHRAIVHTAAASNLGQMLHKVCLADGIPLVNIVRSDEQVELLKTIGAEHVLNSRDENFREQLSAAIETTGATVAFDAIGGGTIGSQIVQAMERGATRRMAAYSRYGSDEAKQLFVYGLLDPSPMVLNRLTFGMHWGVAGWLLTPFLQKAGPEVTARLVGRVLSQLTTTFASHYTRTIGLTEALQPDVVRAYERKATGEKYLIDPSLN